ncbi:MAG TPA: hypothetical protein VN181_11170 [Thermoanaerobaculia bacterium]|nr:hypothetical protein [Thermoanaerobaculia bacterium]
MPKILFYAGTAFLLFLALTSAGEVARELESATVAFAALPATARAPWAILAALAAGLAIAAIFLRMAALLAARNLFAAFLALLMTACALASLAGVLLVQWRLAAAFTPALAEVHFAALMALGFFLSVNLLSLRPYFSIQASRFISAIVFFPLPLFVLTLAQELFMNASVAPLPASTPASQVWFGVVSLVSLSIAVHCIRHRHLFLEMTNLRELLDSRHRGIGHVAFDS